MTSPSWCRCISARGLVDRLFAAGSFDLSAVLTLEPNIRAVLEVVEPSNKKRESELEFPARGVSTSRSTKKNGLACAVGGERRRARSSSRCDPPPFIMLLDEPFAGYRSVAVGELQDLVRHLNHTAASGVLITDHMGGKRWD